MNYEEPQSEIDNSETGYNNEANYSQGFEPEELVRDWSEAVKANRYYGEN